MDERKSGKNCTIRFKSNQPRSVAEGKIRWAGEGGQTNFSTIGTWQFYHLNSLVYCIQQQWALINKKVKYFLTFDLLIISVFNLLTYPVKHFIALMQLITVDIIVVTNTFSLSSND